MIVCTSIRVCYFHIQAREEDARFELAREESKCVKASSNSDVAISHYWNFSITPQTVTSGIVDLLI